MKLHPRFTSLALIAMTALVASCSDKTTNPVNNPGPLELNSGDISDNNGTFSHTFANAGTYNYRCTRHSGMNGSVQVAAGHPATATVSITDNQFTPATALVAPAGTVTWTNNGAVLHTVTSTP